MSRTYYFKTEYCVDFIGMQETLEMIFNCDSEFIENPVSFYMLEPSEGEKEAALFYIEGKSAQGVRVSNKEGYIIVKMSPLCNYSDYELAGAFLNIEVGFLKTQIIGEDGSTIVFNDFFSDKNIQKLREEDAKSVLAELKTNESEKVQISGVFRKVNFDQEMIQGLLRYENEPAELVNAFDKIMHHLQYEISEHNTNTPEAEEIHSKDSETEKEDNYQYHGNHWDCVLKNPEAELLPLVSESIEKGILYGNEICHYTLDEKLHGVAAIIEYNKGDSDSPIVIRDVIAKNKENKNVFVSGYPVIKTEDCISLKISEIQEWENGLEGWITGELPDGRTLTFFDADFAIMKDKYEVGRAYNFHLGAFAYFAKEPESKGFKFEGQQAIDFRAKLGEAPEYDEDGNVKPVEFSTESLCAFFQGSHAPDEAEFISTVEEVKSVEALGKKFWTFDVIYRSEEDDGIKIPTFVLQSEENESIQKATQLEGLLWLTGYAVS
ncbi:MAG: DUF4299 domain-containing protein [Treponema sp.]|nr:DUF4299 domain-containing protein [Treponema sp.]